MSKKVIFETKVDYLGFPIMEAKKVVGHRIEAGYNEENPYKGPTTTADVCENCFNKLKADDTSLNDVLKAGRHKGEPKKADYWAAEAIPHPTYQDGDYKCQSCGVALRDDPRDDVSFAESVQESGVEYVIKIDGEFFVSSSKTSEEYPDARKFGAYEDAMKAIDQYDLISRGHVELFLNYGKDDEEVEDVEEIEEAV